MAAEVRLSKHTGLLVYHAVLLGKVLDHLTLEYEGTMFPLKCLEPHTQRHNNMA